MSSHVQKCVFVLTLAGIQKHSLFAALGPQPGLRRPTVIGYQGRSQGYEHVYAQR